jgi:hypothetical protein
MVADRWVVSLLFVEEGETKGRRQGKITRCLHRGSSMMFHETRPMIKSTKTHDTLDRLQLNKLVPL